MTNNHQENAAVDYAIRQAAEKTGAHYLNVASPLPDAKKKSWQEKRKNRLLQISLTQLETFDLCHRKWALERVRQLPAPEISGGPFGTVTHAVIERFLKADALGRDEKGNPVNLYPEKWTEARNRYKPDQIDGTVTAGEAEVITKLIAAAIEDGILARKPDQMVEVGFTDTILSLKCPTCEGSGNKVCTTCQGQVMVPVLIAGKETFAKCPDNCNQGFVKCPTCDGDGKGDTVTMTGFIDSLTFDTVEDHKSTKSMKYAKSKNDLLKNIQMMGYAKQLLDYLKEKGKPIPDKICLRHNVYCKDPNDLRVRKTEVFVTPEEIMGFWEGIKVMAAEMSAIRRNFAGWHTVPPPSNMARACQAYGGCQFRSICAGQESEEAYEKRIIGYTANLATKHLTPSEDGGKVIAEQVSQQPTSTSTERKPMGLLETMKQRMAVAGNAAPGAAPVVVQATAPAAQVSAPVQTPVAPSTQAIPDPVAPAADEMGAPAPWANPTCTSCGGVGFATSGSPCRICDVNAARSKARHGVAAFDIQDVAPGLKLWKWKANPVIEGFCPISVNDLTVKRESVTQLPAATMAGSLTTAPVTTAPTVQNTHNTIPATVQTATMPAAAAVQASVAAPAPGTRTRTKKGFTLVLNAVVTFGSGPVPKVTRLVEVFREVQGELEKAFAAAGKPMAYHDMDSWKRRDEVAKAADAIAEKFGTDYVVADIANGTPDFKAFVEAIRPLAAIEILGTN